MKFVLLSLLPFVNSYFLPKIRILNILKNNEELQNTEQQNNNNKIIKEIIEEDYSTEWEYYNETWKNKS